MGSPMAVVDEITSWLDRAAEHVDSELATERDRLRRHVQDMNELAASGDDEAHYSQQLLLSRIYRQIMQIPDGPNSDGSVLIHEITRLLETATIAAEDSYLEPGILDGAPVAPRQYLTWLKQSARAHPVFKHPYYMDFIKNRATVADLRNYVIQESVVDGRFDDLLAMMQVGTSGGAKMEIARNYWDEMGNGNQGEVHTHLFSQIFDVLDITSQDLQDGLSANALLSGNLAVLLCRYRQLYAEAAGFLGMTEWLVPDRFVQVVHAWERLGLPPVGIVYHRLHITVDSQHAAGWFHNVVLPAAQSAAMRRGIARGALWRLNSSCRYLDERLLSVTH